MFSSRLPPELAPNALARAVERRRRSGAVLLDLTETNPTAVGLPYPADVLDALATRRAAVYRPDPMGDAEARDAVAATLRDRGAEIDAGQVVLVSSTSEAYAVLFKLLCDPGQSVLVPQPSYPLFGLLTGLDAVAAVPYRLRLADDWAIDRAGVARAVTPQSRAILVVSPNNPTGSMLRMGDRDWLVDLGRERDIALIADEVFGEYPLTPRSEAVSLAGERRVLTFTLGGLSKSAGLPQVKLAWIAVSGPDAHVREALARLEIIVDTYLSVSTPVQMAAPRFIAAGREIRDAIRARIRQNLDRLREQTRGTPALTLYEPEGGWSAVLRMPATRSEEEVVLGLLDDAGVLVHPGYFFDFDEEAFLVVSLLPRPDVFDEAVSRVVAVAEGARRR
jgi:aspartate/methionine/tyrosine aminotransferase